MSAQQWGVFGVCLFTSDCMHLTTNKLICKVCLTMHLLVQYVDLQYKSKLSYVPPSATGGICIHNWCCSCTRYSVVSFPGSPYCGKSLEMCNKTTRSRSYLASFPGSLIRGIRRESLVSYLAPLLQNTWRNRNKTRVFRTFCELFNRLFPPTQLQCLCSRAEEDWGRG